MTSLFRFYRDHNRWSIPMVLVGFGSILIARSLQVSIQPQLDLIQVNRPQSTPSHSSTQSLLQVDDVLRDGLGKRTDDEIVYLNRQPQNWPAMSSEQIEQARITLIHQGFSPMQADMILPINAQP